MSEPADTPCARFGHTTVFFGDKSGKYPDGNQVIVTGADTRVAFDSPLVANRIGEPFDAADYIVQGHIHEDHITGWHRVRGIPVHVHDADLDAARSWEGLGRAYGLAPDRLPAMRAKIERQFFYEPRPDAIGFADGAQWDLGGGVRVHAVHMPGHTAGHCVLIVEPDGVAFIGDIDLTGFGPYYGDASSSLVDFRRTIARLPDLPASTWITSHHRGVYTERTRMLDALAAFAAKVDDRRERLLEMLREQARSLDELVRIRLIYPPGYEDVYIDDAESHSIRMHLDELVANGVAQKRDDGRYALR
ncbi:MAG: MBL fold metallo-hydrolase [Burkholderiaceae bacterium]|nr:MBL fold metallo-hydrolase [Burkholderiaceae bacterium]